MKNRSEIFADICERCCLRYFLLVVIDFSIFQRETIAIKYYSYRALVGRSYNAAVCQVLL